MCVIDGDHLFPQSQGERANTTNLDCVLWHALAIGPVCRMQCTWTSEPAKPRSLARGRSLSDQINSDMSTDISTCHTAVASMHLLGGLGYVLAWESANQLRFACPYLALQHVSLCTAATQCWSTATPQCT